MVDFIVKYWVEIVFGLIVSGGGYFIKRYFSLEKMNRQREQDEFYNRINDKITECHEKSAADDKVIYGKIEEFTAGLTSLTKGLLSVQGRQFKADCKKLLAEEHKISFEEFQQITEDHAAYHALGGNHNGDALFDLVKRKAEHELDVSQIE